MHTKNFKDCTNLFFFAPKDNYFEYFCAEFVTKIITKEIK